MLHSVITAMSLSVCLFVAPIGSAPNAEHTQQANAGSGDIVPRLTVRGNAELEKPADQVEIRLSVVSEADDADDAIDVNARESRDVLQAIERLGLTEDEYQTGQYRVSPQYSRRPRNSAIDWTPSIIAYRVTNTLLVKTKRINDAGKIIQKATEAGANSVESVSFALADPRTHRSEAIREATEHAMFDARILADAAGQEIVRILSLTLDQARAQPVIQRGDAMGRMAMEAKAAPTITPGDVTVTASVTVVLEIAGK